MTRATRSDPLLRHRKSAPVQPSRVRPLLEQLEDRTLLSFSPPAYFSTAQGPFYVIAQDVNGDQILDLATANSESNTVSVLLGRGNGTFEAARSFPTGTAPYHVAAGHFNGDGYLDLATVNENSDNLSVLLGNGDGSFRAPIHTPTDRTPRGLAVGDFNQDGALDVVVAAPWDTVAVHLGNGDGTFRPRINHPAPSNPQSVIVGDLNRDGRLDFVVASLYSASVRSYHGNGDGTFQPGVSYATTMANLFLHGADFNGDGALDVATNVNGNLSLQLNDGQGGLHNARSVQMGGESYGVASGDFDEDGQRDLIAPNWRGNNAALARGNGDGTFQTPSSVTVGQLDFTRPTSVAVADFNGDGSADLAVTNQRTHQVAVLLNRPQAVRLLVAAPANAVAGTAFQLTVSARDEGDTVASNYRGRVRFSSIDPTAGLPSEYVFQAADRGVKTFTVTLRRAGNQTITATDQDTASIVGNATVAVTSAAVQRFAVTGFPSPITAGTAGTFTVAARDEFENTVTGYRGAIRFTSSDGQAVLPPVYIFQPSDNGTRTFSATLRTAGAQTLTATEVTGTLTGTQKGIIVSAAAASELQLEVSGIATSGRFVPLAVRARDPFGNTATGYRGTIRFTTTDPRAIVPADHTFTAGNAGFARFTTLVLRTAGSQTVTVRDAANLLGNVTVNVGLPPVYGSPLHLNVGLRPRSAALGDFNRDGLTDLATANEVGENVSILLGLGDGTFLNAVNYPVGRRPSAVAVGDFNRDGALDLVTANEGSNNLGILWGNGDGTFRAGATYAVGSGVRGVHVADLNADGRLDLVASVHDRNTVGVLLGNANGTFRSATHYDTDTNPWAVTTGDINHDGILDLVTANNNASASVLLGVGNGTFRPAVHHSVGGLAPRGVVVRDLNGDGFSDIATVNAQSGNVSVLRGRGNNTFLTSVQYAIGRSPWGLAADDLTGDGVPDLVTADQDGGVSVLVGFGDGAYQTALNYAASNTPTAVVVGDLDGDLAPDLVAVNQGAHTVSVLHNLAAPSNFVVAAPANRVASVPFTVTVAAVNLFGGLAFGYRGTVSFGSSDPQAVLPSAYTFTAADYGVRQFTVTLRTLGSQTVTVRDLAVFEIVGRATVRVSSPALFYPAVNYDTGARPTWVGVGDLDEDGILDLAVTNQGKNSVGILRGLGDGTFSASGQYAAGAGAGIAATADLNRDGHADLVVANWDAGTVSTLLGNGDGTFRLAGHFAAGAAPGGITVADFNGDGFLDAASANSLSDNVTVLLGNGDGTLRSPVSYPTGTYARDVVAGDFDGDGFLDLAAVNQGPNSLSLLRGNGDGTFQLATHYGVGYYPTALAARDLNGDGFLDVVTANYWGGTISVVLGNGDGTFRPAVHYPITGQPHAVVVADYDGDGILDLAVAAHGSNSVNVLLGNGDGTFQQALQFPVGSGPYSAAAGDFDGDGAADLATANGFSGNVSVLLNATGGSGSPGGGAGGSPGSRIGHRPDASGTAVSLLLGPSAVLVATPTGILPGPDARADTPAAVDSVVAQLVLPRPEGTARLRQRVGAPSAVDAAFWDRLQVSFLTTDQTPRKAAWSV